MMSKIWEGHLRNVWISPDSYRKWLFKMKDFMFFMGKIWIARFLGKRPLKWLIFQNTLYDEQISMKLKSHFL